MRGQLGEKLVGGLLREIAERQSTGLLRISCEDVKKAIFFESGSPVFAISSLSNEQLEHVLVEKGLAPNDLIEALMVGLPHKQQLGSALVQQQILSEEQLRESVRELVMRIILSLFEWGRGDYVFDERLKAPHEIKLDCGSAEVILQGTRRACEFEELAEIITPSTRTVMQASPEAMVFGLSAKLTPVESFVLSRLDSATPVSEAGTYTGLPDDEARCIVCSLVALGLLVVSGEVKDAGARKPSDLVVRKLQDEVARRLHSLSSADYYEIIGVTNLATTGEVEAAYTRLTRKLDMSQYSQPEYHDLRCRVGVLMDKINEAYDVLSNIKRRREYDEQKMRSSLELHKQQLQQAQEQPQSSNSRSAPSSTTAPAKNAYGAGSFDPPLTPPNGPVSPQPQMNNPVETAEYYYKLGRSRYEQRDCHAAVQLLREAVKLDSTRPHYHYFLGVALSIISQARHDKHHDGCHVTCKLGKVLVSNPRLRREAEQHLLRAAELDPTSAQIRLRLGYLYKDAELPKRAEYYFREALMLDPTNQTAQRELDAAVNAKEA